MDITTDDVYVVWYCKTLQNHKALLSTNISDGMYYEMTFNGDKNQLYMDAYKKWQNICFDMQLMNHIFYGGGASVKPVVDGHKVTSVIEKKLLSCDGKKFKIGSDICFILCRNNKEYSCFGTIEDISDESFDINRVDIDNMALYNGLRVKFKEVKDGMINYASGGW